MNVDRTCAEVHADDSGRRRPPESHPLKDYRAVPAYVLLGDPGAGKTTAFEMEVEALGDSAYFVDARDFITFGPKDHPEWRGKTLFIDALDEVRAGAHDARSPLDAIRGRLDKLGRPHFRLSCREADWLAENDRKRLVSVAPPDSHVRVLRLNPLERTDVERILDSRTDIPDGRGFVDQAIAQGVDALLGNPLTLRLLANVVSREQRWPRSRLELFEQATMLLATECNEEHTRAEPQPAAAELLDAAGRLCAVLLISGATGYALGHGQAATECLDISQCEYNRHRLLRRALALRVFRPSGEGCRAPVHQHIAEFVAAKHLARLVSEGLPASRIVALLTGFDGGVVSNLRGIAAWLAALSESARREFIERDPIGVISYGDVHAFSPEHKETLLRALGREESRLDSVEWTESALAAVATRGMEPVLRKILASRNEHPLTLLAVVLFALQHGDRLPSLAEFLPRIVYEENRLLNYAEWALEAFVYNYPDQDATLDKLEQLLQDLSTGTVKDGRDQLMGVALRHLYPARIPPTRIWDYLTESTNPDDYGSFWSSGLVDRSEPDDIATLLDEWATRRPSLKPALKSRWLEELPLDLLARGLELCGDSIERERLLEWLRVDPLSDSYLASHEATQRIRAWLEERPGIQKAIVAEYVSRSRSVVSIHEILYGSSAPPDFGDWCLRQAREATERSCAMAYLRLALNHGVPRDVLFDYEHEDPPLREIMKSMLVCRLPEGFYDTARERRRTWQEERRSRRRDFVALVRSHESDLHANQCNAGLLDALANVYFGGSSDVRGHNPQDRLRNLFSDEPHLIDATLAGFRDAPFREDMPSPHEIVSLIKTDRRYMIALPVLAGIQELDNLQNLSDRQLRQALAFHFTTFTEHARGRGQRLIEVNHAIAAEVLVQCTTAQVRSGTFDDTVGFKLVDGEYIALASVVVLPILRSFPVRCSQPKAVEMLDALFNAALRHVARATFVALIAEKLTYTSMSTAQRVRWLAVQAVADPNACIDCLRKYVARQERRGLQLAAFLIRTKPRLDCLPTPTLVAFVELLGSTVAPWDPTVSSRPYDRDKLVRQLVQTLVDRPDQDAADELAKLCTEPALNKWQYTLVDARDRQLVILRDRTYRQPTVKQVCQTLNGGTPTNAGDLAALLTDRFLELARRIRTENTDDWRQYWNEPRGHDPTPKHEDHCRDALLSDLRPCLPAGVDAQPEGQYANDKRADIRVAYRDFEVPVEIKKSKHRQLWSAARDQLVGQYSLSTSATGGYGVYIVLWFGKDMTQAPPEGSIPTNADELRSRLLGRLSDAERRKISVVVIDVSRA